MKNLELNKLLGALLFVAFVILFSSNAVNIIYESKTGSLAHVSDDGDGSDIATNGDIQPSAKAPIVFDIPALMKVADAVAGEKIAAKCTSCHSFNKGGANKIGPNLYGIIGNKIAHAEGFTYSSAVKNHGGIWDYDSLFHWIHNPKEFIPGNRMAYGGVKNETEIANLVAYLQKMHDSPPSVLSK